MENETNGTNGSKAARKPARKANADEKRYVPKVSAQVMRADAEEFLMLAIALQSAQYRKRLAIGECKAIEREMRAIIKTKNEALDAERSRGNGF